ncbi:MAG: argD [Herminiimonas sp.]|nr:argD [Herminiimonas sp.]
MAAPILKPPYAPPKEKPMASTSPGKRFLAREMPAEIEVAKVQGSFVFDTENKQYIDFIMGWCVGNFGWGNPALTEKAKQFNGPDYVYPGYAYPPWDELAGLLASIAPGKLKTCFRATGGSEAVDIALQAAMVHTGRQKFVSLEGSYHGNTIGALSVGSSEYREACRNLLARCYKIKPPLGATSLDRVEKLLQREDVAAFIMEPISINLGVLIPERQFMTGLAKLCKKYGTLLIMDEVATGFGRTGTLFACEQFNLEPDILCMAKAITGGLGGMGAAIMTPAIARSMEDRGNFYSTYGWHPRSVNVAIATVQYLIENQIRLLDNVAAMSGYFDERLAHMAFKETPELRIAGLAIGVDVHDKAYASRVQAKCRRAGLLLTAEGSTLLILPALDIDQRIAGQGLDILESCV